MQPARPAPANTAGPTPTPPKMLYRKLGRTGMDVSVLSMGSWVTYDYQLGVAQAKDIIQRCYDAGINFFDNAEVYAHGEAERIMGAALAELSLPRSDLVISTKIFFGSTKDPRPSARGLSRKHVVEGLEASLKRLQLDHVDIVFAHRPDPTVPIDEIVRSFNHVIDRGWAFAWGTSEWPAEAIAAAHAAAARLNLIPPAAEQPQYSILHRHRVEVEYDPLYESEYGMGLTTFSPLACGILTGKYGTNGGTKGTEAVPEGSRFAIERYGFLKERWLVDDKLRRVEALRPLAAELGVSLAQLALGWCLANPRVSTVITGATSAEQLEENLGALDVLAAMTPEVMARVEAAVGAGPELALGRQ